MKSIERICETCEECIPIGEGDHICHAGAEPKLVIDSYMPADDYLWCGGKKWEAMYE